MKMLLTKSAVTTLICLPLAFGAVQEAQASVIVYDNGTPNNQNAILSGRFGPGNDALQTADDFTLSGTTEITDFHWWGIYAKPSTSPTTPTPDSFSAFIFSDSSGQPGALSNFRPLGAPTATPTGSSIAGTLPVYSYSVDVAPLTLSAGTYWLSIYNDADKSWSWAESGAAGNSYRSPTGLPGSWTPSTPQRELAFNLTAVPEPLTIGGVALAGVFGAAFKRKLNQANKKDSDKS